MQLPCHFSGKEKSVSSVFHRFFRPKHSHDFTLQARFYTFITKNKTQSQPNDFSSGWKNIFFLRMAYWPVPQIRPKTSWRPFKIVPYRLVFSLIAPSCHPKKEAGMSGKSHFRLSRSIAAYARHALLTFYLRTKTLPYRQKVIPPTYEIRLFPDTPCNGHK